MRGYAGLLALGLALGLGGSAAAGPITEPDITPIYSQASFGVNGITIEWLPVMEIHNLPTSGDLGIYGDAAPDKHSRIVDAFYLQAVGCGGPPSSYILGCGYVGGNVLSLDALFLASNPDLAGEVVAHELGHNLGLDHVSTPGDLMRPSAAPDQTLLTTDQVAIILASPLVQTDNNGQRFIDIRPIDVGPFAAVPEPASMTLLAAGAGGVLLRRRRAKAAAKAA